MECATKSQLSELIPFEVFLTSNKQLIDRLIWVLNLDIDKIPAIVAGKPIDRNVFSLLELDVDLDNRIVFIYWDGSINVLHVVLLTCLLIHNRTVTLNHF